MTHFFYNWYPLRKKWVEKSRSARNFDDVSYLDAILMPKQEKEAFDRYYYCKKTGKINSTGNVNEHIFRFKITVYNTCFFQYHKRSQYLLGKMLNKRKG